jgi:hypothetical protein
MWVLQAADCCRPRLLPVAAQVPSDPAEVAAVQRRLAARYPVGAFNAARWRLDPHNILGSPMMDALLPHSSSSA